jgi:hypothetical protein
MLRASHQRGRLMTRRSESFHLMETSSRAADYWLMPARGATGDIEWPQDEHSYPQLLPPHGIEHHYALLEFVERARMEGRQVPTRIFIGYQARWQKITLHFPLHQSSGALARVARVPIHFARHVHHDCQYDE